jgi:hypothetical protein
MIKTLLFNGCSFVAGDALVWQKFSSDTSWLEVIQLKSPEHRTLYQTYVDHFRPQYNLQSRCKQILNVNTLDISMDGNSNENIAFDTVNYIETLPTETVESMAVVVGWTDTSRRHKWFDPWQSLVNICVSHRDGQMFKNLHAYIDEVIVNAMLTI